MKNFLAVLPLAAFMGCAAQKRGTFEPQEAQTLALSVATPGATNQPASEDDELYNTGRQYDRWMEEGRQGLEEAQRLGLLMDSASVVLASDEWETIRLAARSGPEAVPYSELRKHAVPIPELNKLLLKSHVRRRDLAVVRVPEYWGVSRDKDSGDEAAIHINDLLREAGFKRVIFVTIYHGVFLQIFRDGLPTREEARRLKEVTLREQEEHIREKQAGQPNE
jgi:hypothetical protein